MREGELGGRMKCQLKIVERRGLQHFMLKGRTSEENIRNKERWINYRRKIQGTSRRGFLMTDLIDGKQQSLSQSMCY